MRRVWRAACAAGLLILASEAGRGQIGAPAPPGAPPVAATAPGALPGGAAPVAEAAPKAGLIKRMCAALDECRRKICKTPLGQMLNGMTAPATAMTGGIIPPFCPLMPSEKDLQQPGAAGAAAAAQKEALEAKARRQAVRFLGTLDCRYFPDAAVQLAAALRGDSSECVRWEAALVLGSGCCCNQVTIEALRASVSGTDTDGFPAERSVRVRCAAAVALERCLGCYTPPPPEAEEEKKKKQGEIPPMGEVVPKGDQDPDTIPAPRKLDTLPESANAGQQTKGKKPLHPASKLPTPEQVERAWQTLDEFNTQFAAARVNLPTATPPSRQSIFHMIKNTAEAPEEYAMSVATPAAAQFGTGHAPPAAPPTAARPLNTPPASAAEPARAYPSAPARVTAAEPAAMLAAKPALPAPMPVATPTMPAMTSTPMPTAMPAATPPAATTPALPAKTPAPVSPATFRPAPAAEPAPFAPAAADEVTGLVKKVLQGPTPADRHAAIRQMVQHDWRQHPVVASALLASAKSDPTDVVRVDAIRHLAAYKMAHPQVLTGLAGMASDPDSWIRDEAAQALTQLRQQ